MKKFLDAPPFEKRLDGGLKAVFGHSFAQDEPDSYQLLKALWVARNNVAHGKEAIARIGNETRRVTRVDERKMLRAVNNLMAWLGKRAPFTVVKGTLP